MSVIQTRRAEWQARKAAHHVDLRRVQILQSTGVHATHLDHAPGDSNRSETGPVHEWRFGVGQTGRQEQAEMDRAKVDGRCHEYTAAQAVVRAAEQAEQARPKPPRKAAPTPPPKPRGPAARTSPLFPMSTGDPDAYGNGLLADHARGRIGPVLIPIPDDLPDGLAEVARFVALGIGLRLSFKDDRPAPLARGWVAGHLGWSPSTVARALVALVRVDFLTHEGNLPARGGRRYGTALYGIPGVTAQPGPRGTADDPHGASDGMPVAGFEPRPVPVEGQHVSGPGPAVKPPRELVDEPGVGDAVRGGPAGDLDGPPAVEGSAENRLVIGHAPERYARRPTVATLLARALEGPVSARGGSTRDDAMWLACQLRDNGHDEHGDAYGTVLDFAARQSACFTSRDALRILSHAYGRPPRPPWGNPTGGACTEVDSRRLESTATPGGER